MDINRQPRRSQKGGNVWVDATNGMSFWAAITTTTTTTTHFGPLPHWTTLLHT